MDETCSTSVPKRLNNAACLSLSPEDFGRDFQRWGDFYLLRNTGDASKLLPTVKLGNQLFYQHMGVVLAPVPCEELTSAQIIQLARLRSQAWRRVVDQRFVEDVYDYAARLWMTRHLGFPRKRPWRILDFGAGTGSLLRFLRHSPYADRFARFRVEFTSVDIDTQFEAARRKIYAHSCSIGYDSALPFSEGYFDTAIALYVFHYGVPEIHLRSIHQTLSKEGLFIFNLYRPRDLHRTRVLAELDKIGFNWQKTIFESHRVFNGLPHAPVEFYLCTKK